VGPDITLGPIDSPETSVTTLRKVTSKKSKHPDARRLSAKQTVQSRWRMLSAGTDIQRGVFGIVSLLSYCEGHAVAHLVEALRYKPEGHGFDYRCCHSGRTMALASTQPLAAMSTRSIFWWVKAAGAYGWLPCHRHVPIVEESGSLNLLEPSGPVQACNGIAFAQDRGRWRALVTAVMNLRVP